MNNQEYAPYVIVTPARNEEDNIDRLIRCVISQTVLPARWVIVSDGSTDRTDAVIKPYLKEHNWIVFLRMPEHRDRQFAAKVQCFNAGYNKIKNIPHEVVGNLDADLSFEADYFDFLMAKFMGNPRLGVAGTPFVENDGYSSISDSFEGSKHVAGGCQLFRKACFEQIGGYVPNKAGGIDWIAVTTARMKGWQTQTFPEKFFYHHRSLGTGDSNKFVSNFNYGRKDYYLGNHPLWEAVRVVYQCLKPPFLIRGLTIMSGYLWALITRMERPISDELMKFHRDEEMRKLKAIISHFIRFRKINRYDLKY